jgi:glycosyltransferase involved in cell wall biosynthesis
LPNHERNDPIALADALGRRASDENLRRRFGDVGRRLVENEFSAMRVRRETCDLCDRL